MQAPRDCLVAPNTGRYHIQAKDLKPGDRIMVAGQPQEVAFVDTFLAGSDMVGVTLQGGRYFMSDPLDYFKEV